MNRRQFIGGVALLAAVRAWPFRVYGFPSEPTLRKVGGRFVIFINDVEYSVYIDPAKVHEVVFDGEKLVANVVECARINMPIQSVRVIADRAETKIDQLYYEEWR